MDIASFRKSSAGRVLKTPQGYFAFWPNPLPPKLVYTDRLTAILAEAQHSLGELAGVGRVLENPQLLISPYVRREAVLSSRIEGTIASLSDLFIFEAAPSAKADQADVREVHNYVRALERGLRRLPKLPLSLRLIQELHQVLMQGARGEESTPGEFRRRQNWVGRPGCSLEEAAFVPPPVDAMREALDAWEKFIQLRSDSLPVLVQCGLLHYQFEAIHPFLDGNGRVGRLLLILFLCERELLPQPLLYLSAYFDGHRDEYFSRLQGVDQRGEWAGWLEFFLRGVATQAREAIVTAGRILALHKRYREELRRRRATAPTLALLDQLFVNPFVMVPWLRDKLGVSFTTAQAAVERLVDLGILTEITGRRRQRIYRADELLRLSEGQDQA